MSGRVAALIAAAGSGERLGRGPKAFVRVAGKTLLEWALDAFRGEVDSIVVAVAAEDAARAATLAPGVTIVAGGATRQETVRAMLAVANADVVLVHDAARPFLPAEVLRRVRAAARSDGAASASLEVVDSLVEVGTGEAVARETLRAVQTPQGFHHELLLRAHALAETDGVAATDDAALVRRLGHPVTLVRGSPLLGKVTLPEDLVLAEAVAASFFPSARRGA